MADDASYPDRVPYPVKRETFADTHGPRCLKCGGHAPGRSCRRCGRLPRMIKTADGWQREIER